MKISIEHVYKQIKTHDENGDLTEINILNDICMDLQGTKISTIIGPSGSGKTTLLRMFNKLDSPTQGRILLNGQDISEIAPRELRKCFGMVFQVPALFRGTVFENVAFGPRLYKKEFNEKQAKEILKMVGLANLNTHQNVENLSLGQQQRISFARALANEPQLLLLDEPTSALDPTTAFNLLDLIHSINRDLGIGIIMVTHVMAHARRISDDVCLLVEGKVVEIGDSAQFFDKPKTEIARKFIRGEMQ